MQSMCPRPGSGQERESSIATDEEEEPQGSPTNTSPHGNWSQVCKSGPAGGWEPPAVPGAPACREQLCPPLGAPGGTRSQGAPTGARTASATHGSFRKLRSEPVDNKILKPWCWYSSPPFTPGTEQHGSQQQNCQSSDCSEECFICAEIMGQNENQR